MLRDEFRQLTAMSGRTQRQFARVRRFLVARGEDFDIAERNYQRLMRRAAQICALDGAVVTREDEPYPLADFAVHAVERLLSRYRRLISQAALSCFGGGRGHREFIESFGYKAPPDWLLPYWPLWVILVLDASLFLVAALIGSNSQVNIPITASFLVAHGLAQVLAVSWAVFPKARTNFAMPSLFSFPWPSYIVFGALSYISGASILLILNYVVSILFPGANPRLNDINPYALSFVFSYYFPVITVCLSFLTDLHLRRITGATWSYRVLDGFVGASAMGATYLLVRVTIYLISGHPPPTWNFLYVVATIGALIGMFIPGTAASYLSASEAGGVLDTRRFVKTLNGLYPYRQSTEML